MPNRKVYPRPPAPSQAESYSFRPSSPVNQQSNSSPHSFFSRSPKPPKPKTEVSKIPWESSQPVSPIPSTSSPPQSNPSTVARPASPHSIYSYTSSNSSSRWSHGWGTGGARTRGASAGSSPQDVFRTKRGNSDSHFERGGSIGGLGGWSEDEEDIPLSGSGSGRKGSGGKRGMMRQAFGLEKKASNFSLRGLIRRGRDSFDQDFSPPPSPTSPFQPLMQRQQSSTELAKNQNLNSRPSPRSPLLPLPISPSRDRTVSSPTTYPSPESAGVKGKAARLLGEEIVPHGKAARLLGVERKPTLRTRPSVASLAESSIRSNDDGREAERLQASPEVSFARKIFDSPSSLGSLPPPPSISTEDSPSSFTTPQVASPTMSPPSKTKHRYNNSASDPFWQSDLAQQHQTTLRGHIPLEESIKEEEDQLEPFPSLPLESRLSLDIPQSSSGLAPSSPPSDPTDSVYISDSPNRSSLYSFSLDLNHLSTFSSMTNFRSLNEEDSPVENLISRSNSPNPLPRLRSSIENQSRRSQNSSPSHSARFSYSPTTSSSARGSSSRLSLNPYASTNPRHSVSMTAVTLGAPILPAPSSALPPLPNVVANSKSVPSLTSAPSSPPPKQSLPPLPTDAAPRIPSLLPLPPFFSLAKFPSPPSSPPSPESPSRQVSKPTRSNTLASVASAGTRRRQQANALEALEGRRRADSSAGKQKLVTAEGGEERGSRKRAAGVRQQNRAVQQKIEGEVVGGETEELPRKKDESFLDLDGSDVEAGEEEEEDEVKEEGEVEGTKQSLGEFQTEQSNSAQSISGLPLLVSASLSRRQSISSLSSIDSRASDSSLFSTLPMDVTAFSFPRPPSSNLEGLPYLASSSYTVS